MTHAHIFWGLIWIGILILAARMIKSRIKLLERLYLPSSIIAGLMALVLGPQVMGALSIGPAGGLIPASILNVWRGLPGLLISVVFAALFLGKPVPGLRAIWLKAGPQTAFGQTLAWGQYVVGITLGLLVLTPVFGMSPLAGALIEISFEGGHGTAAGMAATFRDLGFPEGADLALGLATIGLVGGVVLGTILINWAVRRKIIDPVAGARRRKEVDGDTLEELKELQWEQEQAAKPSDPLSIHLGLVGLAIGVGWLIKAALLWLEHRTWGGADGIVLIRYVPLFPLAMIGGVLVQIVADRTGRGEHINRRLMNRISGTALDFTIVAALGTLSLSAIGRNLGPFLLLGLAGILWNLACLLWLAPRIIPVHWFERGIGDFGQSTGVTVTGLLLMRMA
ncbi:MAG: sodium:glutamate symporter, partial [Lentisphaerae bacterium]|nr:sodium:glutamate symporter [Lentisphaerota bacterium]